jgi:hypothetical protein
LVIKALDQNPDPYWIRIGIQPKMLDPDPDEINADPHSCLGPSTINLRIIRGHYAGSTGTFLYYCITIENQLTGYELTFGLGALYLTFRHGTFFSQT